MLVKKIIFFSFTFVFINFSSIAKIADNGINYEYLPNSGKPILVLSTPLGLDLTVWQDIIPLLQNDFSILTYDLRGHGKSKDIDHPYTVDIIAQEAIHLLDYLNIKEAYYLGNAISGYTAQYLAIHNSDRIKKVVISNINSSNQDADSYKFFMDKKFEMEKNGAKAMADYLASFYFLDNFKKLHKESFLRNKKALYDVTKAGYLNMWNIPITVNFTKKDLSEIKIPVLIIQGKHDKGFPDPEKVGKNMHAAIPGSKLEILNTGHIPAMQTPKEYAKILKEFLLK